MACSYQVLVTSFSDHLAKEEEETHPRQIKGQRHSPYPTTFLVSFSVPFIVSDSLQLQEPIIPVLGGGGQLERDFEWMGVLDKEVMT